METNALTSASLAQVQRVVKQYWGFDALRPLQEQAIAAALSGRDALVVLPTGGGKSLCFQAPATCLNGLTVVVSPLISLMKDQVDGLVASGVAAACVNSTIAADERKRIADTIRRGELDLLYVAPERLVTERMLAFLGQVDLALFAVDEAHCISSWGHDFRPEYRGLAVLRERFPGVAVHAYTATATERVREDIARQLNLRNAIQLVGSFDRPNLVYRCLPSMRRDEQLATILQRHQGESGIIYCISRRETEELASQLTARGIPALPYHAGLDDAQRHRHQDAFLRDEVSVIVATVAFGMGIDKSNVRFVVHAGMPKSLEAYQQESGRAGRDGLEAECLLLYRPGDFALWQRMLEKSGEVTPGAEEALLAMYRYATGGLCRHRVLVEHFGQQFTQEDCGACDVCLGELNRLDDALVTAQKILSCVVRLDERYGADYTAQVLVGAEIPRIYEKNHHLLSTYGILNQSRKREVRGWIEQLVGDGFLARDGEYQVLRLTERGREVLRGNVTPRLFATAQPVRSAVVDVDSWSGVDRGLFAHLRSVRGELAADQGVPAYLVFSDATLREMARRRPASLDSMLYVKGIGEKKLASYGERFLQEIEVYCGRHGLTRQ